MIKCIPHTLLPLVALTHISAYAFSPEQDGYDRQAHKKTMEKSSNKQTFCQTKPAQTKRVQTKRAQILLDTSNSYPDEWNELSINGYFKLMNDKTFIDNPQQVYNWCNGMAAIFADEDCGQDVSHITLARFFNCLGKAGKQNNVKKVLRHSLQIITVLELIYISEQK